VISCAERWRITSPTPDINAATNASNAAILTVALAIPPHPGPAGMP
jgi:hypothetical protein